MKVVLSWPETDPSCAIARRELAKRLSEGHQILAPKTDEYAELARLAKDAEVLYGQVVPRNIVALATSLKMLQIVHAGVSESDIDFDLLKNRGIVLGNVAGSNAIAVAEMAMALLLALSKRLISTHNAVTHGRWVSYDVENVSLYGRTVGVVGLGRIGSEIAVRCKSFGMKVVGVKKHSTAPRNSESVDFQGTPKDLDKVLSDADFVVLSVPSTPETQGLMGERELKLMKPSAFLINVCRAAVIQEKPLARGLKEGWIAGYASDVWFNYPNAFGGWHAPILSREEIHLMDNVVVSPDRSVATKEAQEQMITAGAVNIEAFLKGKPLPNRVDLEEEY